MDFIAVLADNVRSQAYIQTLVKEKMLPSKVIILNNCANNSLGIISKKSLSLRKDKYFFKNSVMDIKESLIISLEKNNISYEIVNNANINSDEACEKYQIVKLE